MISRWPVCFPALTRSPSKPPDSRSWCAPAIALNANDKLAVGDLTLEVGAVTESIEVTAQAALLQTESVERSATITGKQIENIEVNGRNPLDMAKLVPGVQFTTGTSYAVGSSSATAPTTSR